MRKPVFSVMLTLLLLAGLVVATGAAGDEPEEVRIKPWENGKTYDILPGQVGVIRYGWAACNKGLVRVFINASNFEETLVDTATLDEELHLTPEDVDELWGKISPADPMEACIAGGRPAKAYWQYVLDSLGPGEYELRSRMWIDHTLVDGADLDGDGKITVITPDMFYSDTLNTIHVHSDG